MNSTTPTQLTDWTFALSRLISRVSWWTTSAARLVTRQLLWFAVGSGLVTTVSTAETSAAIFRWDTGQLIPGTASIIPGPDMKADNQTLDFANLRNRALPYASFQQSGLNNADFSGSQLDFANLSHASLSNAKFQDAVVEAVRFQGAQGWTAQQLYSTRSYADRRLHRIDLSDVNVAGWNFAQQELIGARFDRSQLANTNFSQAEVVGASFMESVATGWTAPQLYATASYQRGDLHGMRLGNNLLDGWNFSGQNLTFANFQGATLWQTNFQQAQLGGATFDQATLTNVAAQQADMTAAKFRQVVWQAADLRTARLSDTVFDQAELRQARFDGTDLRRTSFQQSNLTGASFQGAVLYANNFSDTTTQGFTFDQLASTRSYRDRALLSINLSNNDLSGWDFRSQDLTGSYFSASVLKGTDFTNAVVRQVTFPEIGTTDFAIDQLYATRSYRLRDLSGLQVKAGNLTGAQFAGMRLSDAAFDAVNLTGADFSLADLRGAILPANTTGTKFVNADLRGAVFLTNQLLQGDFTGADMRGAAGNVPATRNLIGSGGQIDGLNLQGNERLVVRNHSLGTLRVVSAMTMSTDSMLEFRLDRDAWGSQMHVPATIVPQLNGTLMLDIEQQTNPADLIGRTFQLFNWGKPLEETNQFARYSLPAGTQWDLSQLYATGEVKLTAYMASDFDSDRDTDSADLLMFLENWTGAENNGAPTSRWQGDRDVDGDVDTADLLEFLAGWTGAAATAGELPNTVAAAVRVAFVPEPSGLASLAGLGWLSLWMVRRVSWNAEPARTAGCRGGIGRPTFLGSGR